MNPTEKPSPKNQRSWRWPGRPITRPTSPILSRRGYMTSPPLFSKWPRPLTSCSPRFMRCRRAGVVGGVSELPTEWQSPLQKISISLELFYPLSHQNNAPGGHPFTHNGGVAWLSALGVERKAWMRGQWPTTCRICITTWVSSVPAA